MRIDRPDGLEAGAQRHLRSYFRLTAGLIPAERRSSTEASLKDEDDQSSTEDTGLQ